MNATSCWILLLFVSVLTFSHSCFRPFLCSIHRVPLVFWQVVASNNSTNNEKSVVCRHSMPHLDDQDTHTLGGTWDGDGGGIRVGCIHRSCFLIFCFSFHHSAALVWKRFRLFARDSKPQHWTGGPIDISKQCHSTVVGARTVNDAWPQNQKNKRKIKWWWHGQRKTVVHCCFSCCVGYVVVLCWDGCAGYGGMGTKSDSRLLGVGQQKGTWSLMLWCCGVDDQWCVLVLLLETKIKTHARVTWACWYCYL